MLVSPTFYRQHEEVGITALLTWNRREFILTFVKKGGYPK